MMQMRYKVTITSHTRLELPITNPLHSAVPSEDVPSTMKLFTASESTDSPSIIKFDIHHQTPGPQIQSNRKEPINYFTSYFTNELIDNIIKETNTYVNEKIRNTQTNCHKLSHKSTWYMWQDVTKQEILAFIAIHLPNLQEYWSTDSTSNIPFFSETFSRDRFLQIFWMLLLKKDTRNDNTIKTRIQKASNYLEYIDSKCSEYFIPYKAISFDKSVLKFKVRISFITYNPNKPTK
uniref:PiggyBac transposable element-derived protein domain-containing protein n=1 Tax=Glossina palpalis gambiensis TaxID=67801 RepID=A0A1B0BVD3_9MUSC